MRKTMMLSCAAALVGACGAATAQIPEYIGFQVQARAGGPSNFNLPAAATAATLVSTTPWMNNNREVVFLGSGGIVWYGQDGAGSVFYTAPDTASVSRPTINDNGVIAFGLSGTQLPAAQRGVYTSLRGAAPALFSNQPLGATAWDVAIINDSGVVGTRPSVSGGNVYATLSPSATVYLAQSSIDPASNYNFLATHWFNNANQFSSVARTNDNVFQVVRLNAPGDVTVVASAGAEFSGFLNNTSINDLGQVAFRANRTAAGGGGAGIFLGDDAALTTIALTTAGGGTFSAIDSFAPVTNNLGLVAFRGTRDGVAGVYIGDGTMTELVAGVGSEIMTDLGLARITGFTQGIHLNDLGEIAFNAQLQLVATNADIGRAVVVAIIPAPGAGSLLAVAGIVAARRRRR